MQRPSIDEVRFTTVTRKSFSYDRSSAKSLDENCKTKIENENELSLEWNSSLNAFLPWTIELMGLDQSWTNGQVDAISVGWEWSGDDWLMKINSIAYSRSTIEGEVPMSRSGVTGKITMDNFEIDTIDLLHALWDQCWNHINSRPQQLSLLDDPAPSPTATRSKAPGLRLVS